MRRSSILILSFLFAFLFTSVSFLFTDEPPKRDIFQSNVPRPVVGGPQGGSQPIVTNLEGVSIGAKGSFAIINGILLHEGEEKSGIKVVKIKRREVDIEINGVPRTLEMVVHEGMSGKGAKPEAPKPDENSQEAMTEEQTPAESAQDSTGI